MNLLVGQASRLPLGRLAPAFVAGETPAQTAGRAAPLPIGPSSWSQCAAQTSWGLSFHEPENARLDSEGLTRFRFMVPMHAEKNRKGALHEPLLFVAERRTDGSRGLQPKDRRFAHRRASQSDA